MTIGIIGAMEPEVNDLIEALDGHEIIKTRIADIHKGSIKGKDVAIVQCGIGKCSAAAVTAVLIDRCSPSAVVNTGCAGAIAADLHIGDVIFSTKAAHHDADLTVFGYAKGQMAGHELFFNADPAMMAKADIAAANIPELKNKYKSGLVVSGDQFINTPERRDEIRKMFPDAAVCEMEGAAIAQICYDCETPFLIIRAVSDAACEGESITYDEFMPKAAALSAKFVTALLPLL